MQANKRLNCKLSLLICLFLCHCVICLLNMEKISTQCHNNSDILSKFAFGKQNVMLAVVVSSCIGIMA